MKKIITIIISLILCLCEGRAQDNQEKLLDFRHFGDDASAGFLLVLRNMVIPENKDTFTYPVPNFAEVATPPYKKNVFVDWDNRVFICSIVYADLKDSSIVVTAVEGVVNHLAANPALFENGEEYVIAVATQNVNVSISVKRENLMDAVGAFSEAINNK